MDALMRGDIDGIQREMEEEKFRRTASFAGHFRQQMLKQLRPALVAYFEDPEGAHYPTCGLLQKGDLLRWRNTTVHGLDVRLPSLRQDMVSEAVAGNVSIKGTELLLWIASKFDKNTRKLFLALRRSLDKK